MINNGNPDLIAFHINPNLVTLESHISLDSAANAPLIAMKPPTPTSIKLHPYISVFANRLSNIGKSTAIIAILVANNNDDIKFETYGSREPKCSYSSEIFVQLFSNGNENLSL